MENYTEEQCKKDTAKHIYTVKMFMLTIISELMERAENHDKTKLVQPELDIFVEYTPKLKNSKYGSEEYKGYLREMRVALDHHYQNNRHHPEHFKNGIEDMNLLDMVEMVCDWKAATLRHEDGDIFKSIDVNQKRFGYSDELAQIFKNTVSLF